MAVECVIQVLVMQCLTLMDQPSNIMSMIMETSPFGRNCKKFEYYGRHLCRIQTLPPKTMTHYFGQENRIIETIIDVNKEISE